ncbi:unnamed protein product, partial [Laminaria digitata]
LEPGFLAREYKRALKNRLSPPCGKPKGAFVHHSNLEEHSQDQRKLICYHCGVACDLDQMRQERTEHLVTLGALKPAAKSPLATMPEPEVDKARKARLQRRPMLSVDQGTRAVVRIGFSKLGRIVFSGHLDLVRLMPRVFRRAKVPLFFSEGFNPLPQMAFGPALSLGISALHEYVDVKLRREQAGLQMLQNLHEHLQPFELEGVHLFDSVLLGPEDKGLTKVLDRAVYVAGLPAESLALLGLKSEAELIQRIETRRAGPLEFRKVKRGIGRVMDLKEKLVDVQVGQGGEVLAQAGLTGTLMPITLHMGVQDAATPNPLRGLRALLGSADAPMQLVRQGQYAVR